MPKHLGLGRNVLAGTLVFDGSKTATALFLNELGQPLSFVKAPVIQLTFKSDKTFLPYSPHKVTDIKTGAVYTGFTVDMQANAAASVDWVAVERV